MLASLPMYDLPETRDATDAYWKTIAQNYGVNAPLCRAGEHAAPWRNPNLLFSQTCGYPYTHEFADQLTYIATPHYDADGCDGPLYCSIIFARKRDELPQLQNLTAAYNSSDSMSGMLALKLVFNKFGLRRKSASIFNTMIESGSHASSLAAVQSGKADVCAIDCVTVALLHRYRPSALLGLHEVARSPSVPGLPYVTRSGDVQKLRDALHIAAATPHAQQLLIKAISVLPSNAYDEILRLESSLST
jgi:ABC-type phosphate/phosphonate transport system substrate-binding protein